MTMTASFLIVTTPVLGATLGLLLRNKPEALKAWLLLVTIVSLGTIVWSSGALPAEAAGFPLLALLPLTAFVTLLGQPAHRSLCAAWLLTLLLLGLGLGVLACEAPLSRLFFLLLLAPVCLMLFHYRHHAESDARWGIGTVGLGMLGVIVAMTVPPSVSSIAFAVACAVALPLAPFHKGYVAALTGLPANVPAFLALLLPVMGFHGLLTVLPQVPNAPAEAAAILALIGMVYGSLKALAQSRAPSVVAYGSLAFFSILWWYLVTARTATPQTEVYVSAVGLATSGLLLAWYVLRARYGEIGFRALSGLAEPMPRFAIVLSLLALAALGFPPFGVFSGFLGMLLAPSFAWSGELVVVLIAWLTASWYLFDFAQGLLFGRERPEHRHEDLRAPELAALALVLVLLITLGIMPARFFASEPAGLHETVGHQTVGTGEGASHGREPVSAGLGHEEGARPGVPGVAAGEIVGEKRREPVSAGSGHGEGARPGVSGVAVGEIAGEISTRGGRVSKGPAWSK